MSNIFTMTFGSGDPRTYTGLSPTMLIFVNVSSGATVSPPSISEALTGSGIYKFTYGVTQPIGFLADAATTSPGTAGRYVFGQLDLSNRIDDFGTTLVAIGSTLIGWGQSTYAFGQTNVAIGTTLIGWGQSNYAFGQTNVAIGTTLTGYGSSTYALGLTLVGYGTSTYALGLTLVGYGTSTYALGLTLIGYGTSGLAIGTSIYALEQLLGSTLVGIGNTSIAIGTSIYALEQNLGSTLVGIGNTSIAYGGSGYALGLSNFALGTSAIALGNTILAVAGIGSSMSVLIGTTASAIGDSVTDPSTLFGFMKRVNENAEGQQQFTKGSGVLNFYDRTGATLLAVRTVSNNASLVTKT